MCDLIVNRGSNPFGGANLKIINDKLTMISSILKSLISVMLLFIIEWPYRLME